MTGTCSANALALPSERRRAIEDRIAMLIDFLDALDPDPDAECYLADASSDLELDPSDREPSLGSFDRMENQENWSRTVGCYVSHDLEVDRSDSEPNLGSVGNCSQEHWAQGIDAEENGDERDWDGDEGDMERDDEDAPIFPRAGNDLTAQAIVEEDRIFRFIDRVKRHREGAHQ